MRRSGVRSSSTPPVFSAPAPGAVQPIGPVSRLASARCRRSARTSLTRPDKYRPRASSFQATMRVMRTMSSTGWKWLRRARALDRGDANREQREAGAPGLDQHLALEHEALRAAARNHFSPRGVGIDPEARLAVLDALPGGPGDPEVREAVREIAIERNVFRIVQPAADSYGARFGPLGRQQAGNLFGRMLPVAIQRDHRVSAVPERLLHAAYQAARLAPVALVAQNGDRQSAERQSGAVGRAVVHHDHARDLTQRALDDAPDRRFFVEGGNDRCDCVHAMAPSTASTWPET